MVKKVESQSLRRCLTRDGFGLEVHPEWEEADNRPVEEIAEEQWRSP